MTLGATVPASAGEAEVIAARAEPVDGRYRIHVTLRHADTGWDHYANGWEVTSPDGVTVFGKRTLHHPHVNEQPFTRSLGPVSIPAGVRVVAIRAHDSVHGASATLFRLELPGR
ncbi:MAG: hypothetical protein ACPGU7_13375 [Gammaproteobacteria bacterium]